MKRQSTKADDQGIPELKREQLGRGEGGGFLISSPDFSDCLSDGEAVDEALENGKDALKATMAALKAKELRLPAPNSGGVARE